jgi:hypothetical protein
MKYVLTYSLRDGGSLPQREAAQHRVLDILEATPAQQEAADFRESVS